jgi:hypothetical protein
MKPELSVVVRLRVTPEDLRKLAEREEEKWKASRVGQSACFAELYGEHCKVEFHFNQDEMEEPT